MANVYSNFKWISFAHSVQVSYGNQSIIKNKKALFLRE